MILMFNKQYREESKLISDLVKKIKKSPSLVRKIKENSEIYMLDTINVEFEITKSALLVRDKSGDVIVNMDCSWKQEDLQEARYYMFSHLLKLARNVYDKRQDRAKQFEQSKKELDAKKKSIEKSAADKAAAEAAIVVARQRLKSL